ncbi:unnamed protein product, partial [Mesorhabditis belari]|uniref:Acyl carrier protein n=1 Tax=Mesorhabditis belari TaxID=2138241 RepID=A0AAF3FHI5_9BILA
MFKKFLYSFEMLRSAIQLGRVVSVTAARKSSAFAFNRFLCPSSSRLLAPTLKTTSQVRSLSAAQPLTLKTVEDRTILVLSLYDKIDPKKLTMDSSFSKDLGLDSLDQVEVVMALEDEFGFEIPDGDADGFKTPRDIVKYICDRKDVFE